MSKREFFSAFLKQGKNIGAIAPSSKYLVKKMIDPIDFQRVKCIVEYGPGTGTITHELLKRMPLNSILLVFEINKEFCEKLEEINDSRIKIITGSAENLIEYLSENNIVQVDYILSSLPFAIIPNNIVNNILTIARKVLGTTGTFIQYQYSLNALRKLKSKFKNVDINFTPMNIPPAFVFVCSN